MLTPSSRTSMANQDNIIVTEIRWLHHTPRRFFTIDQAFLKVFELHRNYKFGNDSLSSERSLLNSNPFANEPKVPFDYCHGLEFGPVDTPRGIAESYLQEDMLAIAFRDRVDFLKTNADPRLVEPQSLLLRKPPLCVDWSAADRNRFLIISERGGQQRENEFTIFDLERGPVMGYDACPRVLYWPVREKLTAGCFFTEDRDLVALISRENIRIVDVRGRERHAAAVVEKTDGRPFIGLQVEAHVGYRFLTYRCNPMETDNDINIYDRRYLKRPIYTMSNYNHTKARIRRCIWNPHRRFSISCLTVDSNKIHDFTISENAYDYGDVFKETHLPEADINNAISESCSWYPYSHTPLSFPGIHNIRTFEWHPKYDSELAMVTNTPQEDNSHIQFFTVNPHATAFCGNNNEFVYAYKQFAAVTESVVSQPISSHRVKLLDFKRPSERAVQIPKEEIATFTPSMSSFGFDYYVPRRKFHNVKTCRVSHCLDCMKMILNTRVDETERRLVEDEYYKKYWDSIQGHAQKKLEKAVSPFETVLESDDISNIIRRRIEQGYGYGNARDPYKTMIQGCQNVAKVDPALTNKQLDFVWKWIDRMNQINTKYDDFKNLGRNYPGIRHLVLSVVSESSQIEEADCDWGSSRVFTNDLRQQMLTMTMWPEFRDTDGVKKICDEVFKERTLAAYIRASFLALAACQGALARVYIRRMADKLKRIPHDKRTITHILALRLHEVIENFNGANLDKNKYDDLVAEFEVVPTLLACVKFIARRLNYRRIMSEIALITDVKPEDRFMFALINMDDKLLRITFVNIYKEFIAAEPLKALALVGLYDKTEVHHVIMKYYGYTSDLQTCTILYILGKMFSSIPELRNPANVGIRLDILLQKLIASVKDHHHKRGLNCVFEYLEMLDSWDMQVEKTFLYQLLFTDITPAKGKIVRPQAVIACNSCGRACYTTTQEKIQSWKAVRGRDMPDNFPNRGRISTCGACRKPLPKCVICRHHYGSVVESTPLFGEADSALDYSFVYCIRCQHGGHCNHVTDWFKDHDMCPASGCTCRCNKRDGGLVDEFVAAAAAKVPAKPKFKKSKPQKSIFVP
uniref:Zinc_ribbon_16 domain-containing protein n=2 Tax=Panagrellus redivivus TaxID=6233 RepID=A0A7E4UZD1_PANRE